MVVGVLTCLALVVQMVCGYNLDQGTATVIHGNNTGSLFGYSVAMWTEEGSADGGGRVLIGAPKYRKDLGREGEKVPPTMGQLNICQPHNYSCLVHPHLPFFSRTVNKALASNGMTLNIGFPETLTTLSTGASPTIMACAPRYPLVALIRGRYSINPGGACYTITGSMFKQPSLVVPFSALRKFPNRTPVVNNFRHTGSSLAGFSVAASTQVSTVTIKSINNPGTVTIRSHVSAVITFGSLSAVLISVRCLIGWVSVGICWYIILKKKKSCVNIADTNY